MLKVGITGGIGSGKSVVAKIFEAMGFAVFYSDQQAKSITEKDPDIREELIRLFGNEVFAGNRLNRKFMADQIFNHPELKAKVNAIIHPKVRMAFQQFCDKQTASIVFNEAAILFETGSYKQFDKMILVSAPESLRVSRVVTRDKVIEDEVLQRMKNQWKDEKKLPLTDFLIINDEIKPLLTQVESVMAQLTN